MNNETSKQTFEIGKVLYKEEINSQGDTASSRLVFIDSETERGKSGLFYTQIALIDNLNSESWVYFGIQAGGGLSSENLREASNNDILKFIEKSAAEDKGSSAVLAEWVNELKKDEIIKIDEVLRIIEVIRSFFSTQNTNNLNEFNQTLAHLEKH